MSDEINVLLTSAGRRRYMVDYFKKALNGTGKVYAMNSSPYSPALEEADLGVISPVIYSDEYIPFVIDFCKSHNVKVVVPLFDVDLPVLSANKAQFEEIGVTVVVSDTSVLDVCNDKYATYEFLRDNGFNTIKTYVTLDSALNAISNGDLTYPLIVKPRWGMGSIAVYRVDNEAELKVLYSKTKNEIFNSYLKYESGMDSERSVLIQEYVKGQEFGMDVINNLSGDFSTTVIRKKVAMRSGETDCCEMVDNKDISEIGSKLSQLFHHIGNMDVDVLERNGVYYVLEMNARFGGGYPFSHTAGINLPSAILSWVKNETVDESYWEYTKNITIHKDICLLVLDKMF